MEAHLLNPLYTPVAENVDVSLGTLYTFPGDHRGYKALIAAKYSFMKFTVASEPPFLTFGETNKSSDFLKKFPLGKLPVFEVSNGQRIAESNAIAHFVSNDDLTGRSNLEKAVILQWINFADHEVLPTVCPWVFPSLSIMQPNKQHIERAKEDTKKLLAIMNDHLLRRTFFVGEALTLADICVFISLLPLFQHVLEPALRAPYGNLVRWFITLMNQYQFIDVIGAVQLCAVAEQFDAKKYAEITAKKGGNVAASAPAPEKKEKTPKPEKKAEKPKAAKVEEKEELDETEAILAAEPASKDPFEVYPKGNFGMDDFKRVYSNEDEKVAIPYFWEKFDKENYSIWYGEYKYPEELTMAFMSCNLISGMYQRLDKMRKHAFGSMILFGEDNKSTISGIWIWRGHDLAFELSPDWKVDYESYNWKKLDADVDDTKKIVNEYLSWTGDFGGKKFNQGKIFK